MSTDLTLAPVQVLDAANFTKGPLARIHLSHHIPHGLHGMYSEKYYGPPDDPLLP